MDCKHLIIGAQDSILSALKQMDSINKKLLVVYSENKFKGLLSIGDIQRAIISNIPLDIAVSHIIRKNITIAHIDQSEKEIKELMLKYRMEFCPVIDYSGNMVRLIMWEELFQNEAPFSTEKFDLPIVIMAGGQGTRLKPLTNIIPKPLIPIGEKTFMEDIMDRFVKCGSNNFYVSVNYKADVIKHYFSTLRDSSYRINYFQENVPLGTAGSLTLMRDKIHTTFFVSNCDIIINEDYSQILKYHKENKNELTVVAALKNYPIAYGVLYTKENGLLDSIVEKPDLTFKINTGLYILEPNLLDEIPEGKFYHITSLIDKLRKENRRIGVFPVSEKSWIDVGNWNEYFSIINK
ncbi:nucleotidyltransferase family protein [Bacteroides fragilis]|jgi:dTDP-glucose pyrophosphorylase|uniref:CBS domain protein n=5 Tax=Bacteroides fragilis TaxID=817 RepID=A0AAN4SKD9_BACFG|nr:nucleotidyltransferase family protein [Bacteroides fragilis]EXY14016.1 CBS domain protein [Bacteroides fragilis str. 1007-1-F \